MIRRPRPRSWSFRGGSDAIVGRAGRMGALGANGLAAGPSPGFSRKGFGAGSAVRADVNGLASVLGGGAKGFDDAAEALEWAAEPLPPECSQPGRLSLEPRSASSQ